MTREMISEIKEKGLEEHFKFYMKNRGRTFLSRELIIQHGRTFFNKLLKLKTVLNHYPHSGNKITGTGGYDKDLNHIEDTFTFH